MVHVNFMCFSLFITTSSGTKKQEHFSLENNTFLILHMTRELMSHSFILRFYKMLIGMFEFPLKKINEIYLAVLVCGGSGNLVL